MFVIAPPFERARRFDLSRAHQSLKDLVLPRLDRATTRVHARVPWIEALLSRIEPTLSLHAVRARVLSIVEETPDARTFWLLPNARFGSFRAGSYVTVHVTIGGECLQRNYSISCAPQRDGRIAITVKRVAGGRVSNWLIDHVRPGAVLELSRPAGRFVLPPQMPPRILLLSAGSGITPVMSMLRQLLDAKANIQIFFMHFARTPGDVIFREELARIARAHEHVRVELCVECVSGDPEAVSWGGRVGRISESLLREVVPDIRSLDTFLCGPPAFMKAVVQILQGQGADLSKLRYERFTSDFDPSVFLAEARVLRFLRSGSEMISNRPRTILEEVERAGIPIASGCRAGNCGACRCRKARGVVVDVTTGLESGDGEGFIHPCISIARGTVELDL